MKYVAAALIAVLTLSGCQGRGTTPDFPLYVKCQQ